MSKRRSALAIALSLTSLVSLGRLAANGQGNQGQIAEGLENWQTSVDLSDKKAGKYNILITGTDRAGNYSFAGPINLYVDPNSDLPIVSITNPVPLMRVGGDLNIVGTCMDDDKVDYVEVKIDDEDWIKASGADYWSYYLSGKTLPDGRHTIVVRGVDINGKQSKPRSVQFDLDRNKPYSLVDSHAAGVLVSGKIKLEGVTQDANGVVQLLYSVDGGESFEKLSISPTKAKDGFSFGFSLDTTKYADGPFVIWFKSTDRVGSVGVSPFLLFVDNTKPTVELLRPEKDQGVNGDFQAVFRAVDMVGLQALSYKFGSDQSGELEFEAGNPFFAVTLKAPQAKSEKVILSITAKDTSGNVTTLNTPIKVDNQADLPVAVIESPPEGYSASGLFTLLGKARDDDGVKAVRYRVDSQAPVEVTTTGSFRIDVDGLAVGKHQILLSAVDIYGREGPAAKLTIVQGGTPPSVRFTALTRLGADKKPVSEEFRAGIEAAPDSGAQVTGIVSSPGKLAKLTWEMSGGLSGTISASKGSGEIPFAVPLPAAGPYGLLDLSVTATDEFGRVASAKTFVYMTDYSRIRREPGFDIPDPRLVEGRAVIGMEKPLRLAFLGEEIESTELSPSTDLVALEREGAVLTVRALKEGATAPTQIKVRTNKRHSFSSDAIVFVTDDKPPEPFISSPAQGSVFKSAFKVAGGAKDGNGIASVSYRLWPSGDRVELRGAKESFEFTPDFASLPEGSGFIEIEALDTAGNPGRILLAFAKDTSAPAIQSLTPVDAVDTVLTVAGLARDPSGVAKVEFAEDGISFQPLSEEAFFSHAYNPVQSPKAAYRLTDRIGNVAVAEAPHFLNPAPMPANAKGPSIAILSPLPNSPVAKELLAAVRIEAAAGLASAAWSFDTQKGVLDPSAGPVWVLRLDASALKGKTAVFKVDAKDAAKGSVSAQATVVVSQAALAPAVEILSPADNAPIAAFHAFAAKAYSDTGVASVAYSIDGGEWVSIEGGQAAALLSGLAPGTHNLAVKAVSRAGIESAPVKRAFKLSGNGPSMELYLSSGKEAPQPLNPGMAFVVKDSKLSGRAFFPNGLGALSAKLDSGLDLKPTLKKVSNTEATFEAVLPANLPYGRIGLAMTAKDALGVETLENHFFYRVAPAAQSFMDEGIHINDDRALLEGGGSLAMEGRPLSARFVGRPLAKVEILPDPKGLVTASFDDRLILLSPGQEGVAAASKLVATTVDGDKYEWGPVSILVDSGPPVVDILRPAEDEWLKSTVSIELTAADPNGVEALEWSLDGESWEKLPLGADGKASGSISAASLPDGALTLRIRATDKAGKSAVYLRSFNKDTVAPVGLVSAPAAGEHVNGYITIAASFTDEGGTLRAHEFSVDGKTWEPFESAFFGSRDVELAKVGNDPKNLRFRATDAAGNSAEVTPDCTVDGELDLPTVKIQLPEEMEVLRADFEISGVVSDDDGIAAVYYKIDDGAEQRLDLEGNYSFAIPIALFETTDNEHVVEMRAEDIFGVQGPKVKRTYRISKAEPVASMENPPIEKTVKGVVMIEGTASDANGIKQVRISVDNANTFNMTDGTEKWTYRFDTRALADGLHSLYVKPLDKYDTEGFFASLINIDNTDPQIILDQPSDGSEVSGVLRLSGRVYDAVAIKSVRLNFDRVMQEGEKAADIQGKTSLEIDMGLDIIITRDIDITELAEGVYNLRIRVLDKADNFALATRTVTVIRKKKAESIDVMYPLKGESITGEFTVNGRARLEKPVASAMVLLDGKELGEAPLNEDGYFSYRITPTDVADGQHTISARVVNDLGETLTAYEVPVHYTRNGPWISMDNFQYGAYLPYRPYLQGRVGWYDENMESYDKTTKARLLKERDVVSVEVSLDNGRTFEEAKGTERWRYRMETIYYPEGAQYLIIKATFADGSKTVARTIYNLDKTSPKVTILAPRENERLNEVINLIGTASDETKLSSIEAVLRPGDKAGYEVPAFIKGLFLDAHALGATYYEVGAGLNFISDDIKLMGFYGQGLTDSRFGGTTFGVKLLANIAYLPFSFLFGPDWTWLSANLAIGANFTYFMETGSGNEVIVSAVVAQLEFPIFTIAKLKFLKKYSFYTEMQLWMVPSDVTTADSFIPKIAFGARISLF
jgi:hypothetical protein